MHKGCKAHFPLFPVVNYLSKLGKDNFRSVLSENGVFQGQDEILFLIMHKEGLKPSEIAKYLHTSLASISVSLKRLEKQGFIEKKNDENDARTSHIFINEKGRTALKNIQKKLFDYHKRMLDGFSEEEIGNLRLYLDRIIFNATGEADYSYKRPHDFEGDEECDK